MLVTLAQGASELQARHGQAGVLCSGEDGVLVALFSLLSFITHALPSVNPHIVVFMQQRQQQQTSWGQQLSIDSW